MIRLIIIMIVGTLFTPLASYGCDACGCAAGNLGIGLFTDFLNNFLRVSYLSTRFQPISEIAYSAPDHFNIIDVSGRYSLGKQQRIRVTAQIPYAVNIRHYEDEKVTVTGLSDVKVMGTYVLFNNEPVGTKANVFLEAGGGINLPAGKYDESLHDKNIPENFNPGKGNWGYLAQFNGALNLAKSGFIVNSVFQLNTETRSGYLFGNQFIAQILAYKLLAWSKVQFIPNAGFACESIMMDKFANDKTVPETGGNELLMLTALNVKAGDFLTGVSVSTPLIQDYSQQTVEAKQRLSVQLTYIF